MNRYIASEKWQGIKTALRVAAYLLAVLFVCVLVARLCAVDPPIADTSIGTVDLTAVDFTQGTVTVDTLSYLIYPDALYLPEDFHNGTAPAETVSYVNRAPIGEYGTARVEVKLPPGEVYAISAKNMSFAQRLFIDGVEYPAIGTVGDHLEAVTPKTTRYFAAFAPTGETTEIVVQYAAFVYGDGGGVYPIELGLADQVARSQQLRAFREAASVTALVVALLLFLGLFLLFPHNRPLLWFALLCGCVGLWGLFLNDKLIMALFPDLNWYLSIRLEHVLLVGIFLLSGVYLCSLFPGAVRRWLLWLYGGFCAAAILTICLTPPLFWSSVWSNEYRSYFPIACVGMLCLFLGLVIRSVIRGTSGTSLSVGEQRLLLTGLALYIGFMAAGEIVYPAPIPGVRLEYSTVGTILFLFFNILALVLGFARDRRELDAARRAEREMQETNRTLVRLNHIRTTFLENITHEMKTPLTAITALAQVIQLRREREGAEDRKTAESLDEIVAGAQRLSDYVDRLLQLSVEQEGKLDFAVLDAEELFRQAARMTAPVLHERGNRLTLRVEPGLPPLTAVPEMLVQVLQNLITNANRHSRDGEITLTATAVGGGMAELRVTDYGDGIPPDLLPRVLERGVSGDGSTGLGLANCKEIVETHGGQLWIDSDRGKGTKVHPSQPLRREDGWHTTVWFTIPLAKEEGH